MLLVIPPSSCKIRKVVAVIPASLMPIALSTGEHRCMFACPHTFTYKPSGKFFFIKKKAVWKSNHPKPLISALMINSCVQNNDTLSTHCSVRACCKVQRQHLVLVRTRRGYSDGYTAHTSGEGGGALVLAPFIVSKASVSCLCLIGRLCRERGSERERGWACGKRTEGGAGACEHTDTSERAKKGNNRGDGEIWETEDKRRGRKESS